MRTMTAIAAMLLLAGVLAGCSTAAKNIQVKSQSVKTNVFTEVRGSDSVPKGFVELTIKTNIKTHIEGYYILESSESLHGKEKYPFLVNIDGQAARWEVGGIKDINPAYEADGNTSRDPEAREGFKYVLEKKIQLNAGSHRVFFGLPEENYSTEVEISLKEGEINTLEFKPIYRTKKIPTRIPTFLKGIDKYEVFLNNRRIL
jgi:predicted small secreted protein